MKTCKYCGQTQYDHKDVVFCFKCGTKFPVEAPKELYYSPGYNKVYGAEGIFPGDVVKYVQAEEAEFLKRQVASQAAIIKNLLEENPKYGIGQFRSKPRSFL